ncbi:dolichyl-phosphate-mannose--protein mannosyltransferase [Microbacterium sp. A82]|uniref:dolichyl-phosphate-mannose--protein mannosyltransferase n=1 Tax=unclassified Microbacterium TaxID=2609290 RepID=UPI003F41AB06
MTAPVPLPPASSERLTRWGRVRDRLLLDPEWNRVIRWLAPLVITALAAALRLSNLAHPYALAFDETYYAKDAWSLWALGYEGTWGDGANEAFVTGDTGTLSETGSYVVHPPLGKWLIALGMGLFGAGNSAAWRLSTAVIGTLTVLLVYLVAKELTRSIVVASVAGLLLAIDGLSIVMSRIALLDGPLTFFILLGFLFILYDRRRNIPPELPSDHHDDRERLWGRILWRRPWVVAAGVALGAASAVKWSGLYALAGFGLYLVISDALARRRAGIVFWPMDAVGRQGPVSFLLLVPAALVTYLITWSGWLVTAGGYDRSSSDNPLVALWNYHQSIYGFHVGLSTGHPYASAAWQWPFLIRPTAVWVGDDQSCGTDHCISVVSTLPNPLIWWAGVAAAVFLLYRIVRGLIVREPAPWTFAMPLVGLAVTYLPWLLYPTRTIFQFYTVVMMPFLVLALVLALREIAGGRDDRLHRRQAGERTVIVFLVAAVLVSAFFYPVWTGMNVPYDFWLIHNWIPTWI